VSAAQKLKAYPFHTAGVPLFFITNGYSYYIGLIPLWDLLLCFLLWAAISALLLFFFKRKLRSLSAAGLITSCIIGFILFYGAFQDGLKERPPLAFFSKYSVLVSLFIVLMIGLYIYCKRSVRKLTRVTFYLNLLFIIFILFDIFSISRAVITGKTNYLNEIEIRVPGLDSMKIKPTDIYFIVSDEYSGSNTLRDSFNYPNKSFEKHLQDQGFFVAQSPSCNYSYTTLSVASILNMDYLQWVHTKNGFTVEDYTMANKLIAESDVITYLQSHDYNIYNNSIFDLTNQPSRFNTGLMSFRLELITHKTLISRATKDLLWHMHKHITTRINWLARRYENDFDEGNQRMIRLTKEVAAQKKGRPSFVYTHLEMPHDPYLFDSLGRRSKDNSYRQTFLEAVPMDKLKADYLQYLVYANKQISALVDDILAKTQRKAIIIVMSDHGNRKIGKSCFNNFNAVYLPGQNYEQFYDTMSNVNQFRIIFNALSTQKLPLLKDSIVDF